MLKEGKIVLEKYYGNYTEDSLWFWFSAGKSLSATLVSIAQQEGDVDIQAPTSTYLGNGWTSMTQAQEDSVKIWHQLTMTTGLDETDFSCSADTCLIYKAPAGSRWFYHNAPYSLLRDVVENATSTNWNIYTNQKIEQKIGMSGFWLQLGYNNFYMSNARDMARFGLLIQNGRTWNTTPVLTDTAYFNQMVNSSQTLNPAYGYLWWLNGKSSFILPGDSTSFPGMIAPDAPLDVITAAGARGQFISISPDSSMVFIRQGTSSGSSLADLNLLNEIWRRILALNCTTTAKESIVEVSPQVTIAPNPTLDEITLLFPQVMHSAHIEVINLHGKMIKEVALTHADRISLSLGPLASGLYWIKVSHGGTVSTHKIFKQ